jgi:type IV pilus assembly protein PilA
MNSRQSGFTLIELMIVVTIVEISAAIAIPAYTNYSAKAKFTEVVTLTSSLKTGVETCVQDASCISGSIISGVIAGHGDIPTAPIPNGNLASMSIANDGTITGIAISTSGLNGATYILKPAIQTDGHVS